jgi:hypothetical protein
MCQVPIGVPLPVALAPVVTAESLTWRAPAHIQACCCRTLTMIRCALAFA